MPFRDLAEVANISTLFSHVPQGQFATRVGPVFDKLGAPLTKVENASLKPLAITFVDHVIILCNEVPTTTERSPTARARRRPVGPAWRRATRSGGRDGPGATAPTASPGALCAPPTLRRESLQRTQKARMGPTRKSRGPHPSGGGGGGI